MSSGPSSPGRPERCYRKVIRITGDMSPNVRLAQGEMAQGREPSNRILVPGVLTWADYQKRRATWDPIRQSIGLDAQFWKGREVFLYPGEWLNRAHGYHRDLYIQGRKRQAEAIGVDPAEGGDRSSWAIVDRWGLMKLVSMTTPDTTVITAVTLALMKEFNVPAPKVCFDRGGGGKEHADRLRSQGHKVKTVAFGESLVPDPRAFVAKTGQRLEDKEERYAYVNRRAEMYHTIRQLLDPQRDALGLGLWEGDRSGFVYSGMGIPAAGGNKRLIEGFALPGPGQGEIYAELRRQMDPIPLLYDPEGRIKMLPKNKRSPDSEEKTLVELVGHSPDELDALAIAVHVLTGKALVATAGGF
jgi:hypothetical protein